MPQLAAAALGGILFAVSYLALGLPLVVGLVAAGASYGAGLLILSTHRKTAIDVALSGIDGDAVQRILSEATVKVDGIAALTSRIPKAEVKSKIEKLVVVARGILDDIRKDPKDARRARQFLNYYLDAVTRILTHYTELTERGIGSTDAKAALVKVESLLISLENAFEMQRASLAADDVLDLDAEISVLEKTLDMEGMKA